MRVKQRFETFPFLIFYNDLQLIYSSVPKGNEMSNYLK
jgi:hypothetical protein